jgi:multiple sugar transport system permease protein
MPSRTPLRTSRALPDTPTDAPARDLGGARGRTGGHDRWFRLLTVLPLLAFLAVFAVYPIVELVRMSVSDVRFANGAFLWSFAGTDNYARAAPDTTFRYSLLITAVFIAVTVIATVVLGTALAIIVHRSVLLAGIARNVLLWPALIAPVVVSVIWFLVLSPNVGSLNKVLGSLGLEPQGWLGRPAGAIGSIILVDVWHWTPLVFIIVYSALQAIDRELLEAARVDGASEPRVYQRIVLPLLAPTIAAAALIRLTMGAKAFDEMYLLTHGGPGTSTTLISLYIRNVFFDQLQLGYGAALSVIVIGAIGVAVALVMLGRKLGQIRTGVGR